MDIKNYIKNMALWLKGGIISSIILFLPLLAIQIYMKIAKVGVIIGELPIWIRVYLWLMKLPHSIYPNANVYFTLLIAFIVYFLIGAIVGFVVQIILKSKNNNQIIKDPIAYNSNILVK